MTASWRERTWPDTDDDRADDEDQPHGVPTADPPG